MFTAYALHIDGPEFDHEVQCATLDEALCHLEHWIESEMGNPDRSGPLDFRVRIKTVSQRQVWQAIPPLPPVRFPGQSPSV